MTPRVEVDESSGELHLQKNNLRLDQRLKDENKNMLEPSEINTILMNLVNRKRFNYKLNDIISYILRCLCIRKIKLKKWKGTRKDWDQNIKKHYQFNEGEDKL